MYKYRNQRAARTRKQTLITLWCSQRTTTHYTFRFTISRRRTNFLAHGNGWNSIEIGSRTDEMTRATTGKFQNPPKVMYRASLSSASTAFGNMWQNYQIKQNHKTKEDTWIYGIGLQRFYTTYRVAEVIGNIRCYRNKIKMLQMFWLKPPIGVALCQWNGQISDQTTVGTITLSVNVHTTVLTLWPFYAARSRACTQIHFEPSCLGLCFQIRVPIWTARE